METIAKVSNSSIFFCVFYVFLVDINECKEETGICPKPGRCVNTLGSFKCICPRRFKLDSTGTYCIDADECLDDTKCPEGCQNLVGGYRCGCPEGYVLHYYYNQCVDDNECSNNPCGGTGNCFNTPGSFRCGCPDGYQFDNKLRICIQVCFILIIKVKIFTVSYFRLVLAAVVLLVLLGVHLLDPLDIHVDALKDINELDKDIVYRL